MEIYGSKIGGPSLDIHEPKIGGPSLILMDQVLELN